MGIPKQVEQQMREVEEFERSLTENNTEAESGGTVASQEQAEQQQTDGHPVTKDTAASEKPAEDWEQKYRSLQGHFNAEVPRLHQANKELEAKLKELMSEVQAAKTKKPEEQSLVTDKDRDQFGDDLIDVQRRVARDAIREAIEPLIQKISERDEVISKLEAQLGKTSTDIAELTFDQRLSRDIPDFNVINNSEQWGKWLDAVDGYTGKPRRVYAEYVYSQGDTMELKRIVDVFRNDTTPKAKDQKRSELERQVQPGRSATSTAQTKSERTYTSAEYDRLWREVATLYAQGQNEKANSLETELSLAAVQGRVR